MEKKIREVPEGFEEYSDPKTGKKYLYNPTTKETRWVDDDKPDWAKKGKAAEDLKKTEGGEKIFNSRGTDLGGGDLAKPITDLSHLPNRTSTTSSTISIKLSNASTERSKNLRLATNSLSSTSVHAAIYESPAVQSSKVTEFPADIQAQLDSSELELQLVLQDVTSMEQLAVLTLEEMKSTSMQQLLEGALSATGSEKLKLSLQCAKADASAPKLATIVGSEADAAAPLPAPAPAPRRTVEQLVAAGSTSSSIRGSKKLKVTNTYTGRSKNVRVLPAFSSSSSAYDWLYEHDGIKTANLLEFPTTHQTALDNKTQEIQITLTTGTGSNERVVSAKQLREQTLEQILSQYPSSDETHMSIQAVDVQEEQATPAAEPTPEVAPPPQLKAMKSNTVGGSVRLKVTNSHTDKSKNVRVMKAAASSASTYDWLHSHEGLQTAQILELPEEQQSGLDQKTLELEVTVSVGGTEKVYSDKELRSTNLMKILMEFPGFSNALVVMMIQVVEAKEEASAADSIEVPPPTGGAKRRTRSANHAGSLRLKVTNSHTGASKNVRVMPSSFSASTSGYDWLYQHDGLKTAKVLEFPEHQAAMDQKTQEIQVTMGADGIDDVVYSAEDLCFKTMPQILDPMFEKLSNPDILITMSLQVVDVKAAEEEEQKEEKEEEMSEEAKEAARLKKKEEEAAFWAAEEAKMQAQAEERKREKEAKLQAALQAEKAATEAAQRQAAEKEAAIKAEEEERLAKREAQKQAALQAEQDARKQIEEERKEQEEVENLDKQKEVEELQSKRKRTSLINQQLAGRSSRGIAGGSLAPFDDDGETSEDDDLLMDSEDKELSTLETNMMLADEEDRRLEIMDSQSLDDEILIGDEDKELGIFESNAMLEEEEEKELEAMDMAVSVAAMTSGHSEQLSDDDQMDDLLAEEEEKELENQIEAEEIEKSQREDTALLAAEEMDELTRMEEKKRSEEQQASGDAAGSTRGMSDEAPLSKDVVPAMDQEESPEDEALDKFERLLETKEVEGKRENERMLALERKAAELEQGTAIEPEDESPRDRSVKSEAPKKRKGGAEARLRKAEQNFVADPARKRSPDVIPLSVQFNDFLRKLRKTVKQVKVYQEARREVEATRTKMVEDFGSLSENTPLYDIVGKKAVLDQIEDIDARKAAEAAKTQGIRSYKSIDQLVELQGKVSAEEYQEEIVKYMEEWDESVSTRVNKAMLLHKKLEQDVLHYENKVAKLRSQAQDLEAKGKFLSSKQAARLNRNEMKLNDAWQIHELECSSICNLLEEITLQGYHDLYPVVKSSVEWEMQRMEREISTYGLGLPGVLKTLGNTVNDVPKPEQKHQIRKEIIEQRNANRDLARKLNKLQALLRGPWTTKSEFERVMKEKNVAL